MYWIAGDAKVTQAMKRDRAHHLLKKTIKNDNDCMVWQGYVHKNYGMATVFNCTDTVHRHIFKLLKGKVKKGMNVIHSCNNFLCINPDHLQLYTKSEMICHISKQSAISRRKKADAKTQTKTKSRTRKEKKDIRSSRQIERTELTETRCQSNI